MIFVFVLTQIIFFLFFFIWNFFFYFSSSSSSEKETTATGKGSTRKLRRPPRYEVEMLNVKKQIWSPVWRGTTNHCEITNLKRGSTIKVRICKMNFDSEKSEYSSVLKVVVRKAMRNSSAWKRTNDSKDDSKDVSKDMKNMKNKRMKNMKNVKNVKERHLKKRNMNVRVDEEKGVQQSLVLENSVVAVEMEDEVHRSSSQEMKAKKEVWNEEYNQVTGGWYWRSSTGETADELPFGVLVDE